MRASRYPLSSVHVLSPADILKFAKQVFKLAIKPVSSLQCRIRFIFNYGTTGLLNVIKQAVLIAVVSFLLVGNCTYSSSTILVIARKN